MIPYTLNDTGITFFLKGQKTFRRDYVNFEELKDAVIAGNVDLVNKLANPRKFVAKITNGNVVITDEDEVLYKGTEVPEYLALRILDHIKQNVTIDPLVAFTEKLMANPNLELRQDLFKWLEYGQMPIYPDGDFLAYKKVRHDYTPIRTGGQYGHLQKVGMVVEQPRETCNTNRNDTCSSGLHFCSYNYLGHFSSNSNSDRIIVLKINPTDVVAIPVDYNDTKGRTCRFEVVDEIEHERIETTFKEKLVVSEKPVQEIDNANKRRQAEEALEKHDGNKTKAASSLGISRSTLDRWMNYQVTTHSLVSEAEPEDDFVDNFNKVMSVEEDSWDSWDDESEEIYDFSDEEDDENDVSENPVSDLYVNDRKEVAQRALDEHETKTAAAKALGISRSTLTRWLNG